MRILIIEDEAPAYRRLHNLLSETGENIEVVDVVDSIADGLNWLRTHGCPDLIMSDIQLSDGLSFEIYRQFEVECPIIFTTAYDEYMLDAFQSNGIDYLLKPLQSADLQRSLEKFKRLRGNGRDAPTPDLKRLLANLGQASKVYKTRFLVKVGSKLIPVTIDEVGWFRYADGGTELHTLSGKMYAIDAPLDLLEKQLDPALFFRINRQYLARIQSIGTVHQYFKGKLKLQLTPTPAEDVTVSRERARLFKEWLAGE